jgi:hypothetical protein
MALAYYVGELMRRRGDDRAALALNPNAAWAWHAADKGVAGGDPASPDCIALAPLLSRRIPQFFNMRTGPLGASAGRPLR